LPPDSTALAAARDGMTPAENMTADIRFSTRPKRLGRPPRYSQRR
jgi:hypothetical protein